MVRSTLTTHNDHYELTRLTVGRVVVTNVDPVALTDAQRFELNEKVRRNPSDFVYVDIRLDGPGGELAFQGALKLRSLFQILAFVASAIRREPEHDVTPDPRTGEIGLNPRSAMQIMLHLAAGASGADWLPTRYDGFGSNGFGSDAVKLLDDRVDRRLAEVLAKVTALTGIPHISSSLKKLPYGARSRSAL